MAAVSRRSMQFSNDALGRIVAALPRETPPERSRLLPDLLRAWAVEDLRDHMTRPGRTAIKSSRKRLAATVEKTRDLLTALTTLSEEEQYLLALNAQISHEAGSGGARLAELGLPDDPEAGERRRDEALLWLRDVADGLGASQDEPPPDVSTRGLLVMLDVAAIYVLVTRTEATRRNNPYASRQAYGPFYEFAKAVWAEIERIASIDEAMKDVMRVFPKTTYSAFVANLQFRHPDLWEILCR